MGKEKKEKQNNLKKKSEAAFGLIFPRGIEPLKAKTGFKERSKKGALAQLTTSSLSPPTLFLLSFDTTLSK